MFVVPKGSSASACQCRPGFQVDCIFLLVFVVSVRSSALFVTSDVGVNYKKKISRVLPNAIHLRYACHRSLFWIDRNPGDLAGSTGRLTQALSTNSRLSGIALKHGASQTTDGDKKELGVAYAAELSSSSIS